MEAVVVAVCQRTILYIRYQANSSQRLRWRPKLRRRRWLRRWWPLRWRQLRPRRPGWRRVVNTPRRPPRLTFAHDNVNERTDSNQNRRSKTTDSSRKDTMCEKQSSAASIIQSPILDSINVSGKTATYERSYLGYLLFSEPRGCLLIAAIYRAGVRRGEKEGIFLLIRDFHFFRGNNNHNTSTLSTIYKAQATPTP